MTCPQCLRVFEMIEDEDGDLWPGHAEWWYDTTHEFLCSRSCWKKAQGELNG